MQIRHYIIKGVDGAHDITAFEIELDGEDVSRLFQGDKPMLVVTNENGEVVQQVTVVAKKIGAR